MVFQSMKLYHHIIGLNYNGDVTVLLYGKTTIS